MQDRQHHFIDGAWTPSRDGSPCEVVDPATEEAFATIVLAGPRDVDAAVSAAAAALPGWRATPPADRSAALDRLLAAYDARAEDLAEAVSREMGAPIDWARRAQVPSGRANLAAIRAALDGFAFEETLGKGAILAREPVGVAALITPWNWPLNQITLKVGAALAAGCTMVLKPSEIAPLSAMILMEAVDEACLPPGVVNLVNGDGPGAGRALTAHPDVAMVSFTGSTRAGRDIGRRAADTFKRVGLELGGKGANLVFADAAASAVRTGARRVFANSGQSCNAPTRMLVERPAYAAAVDTAAAVAAETRVGPSAEPGRHIGPLSGPAQFDRVQGFIDRAIADGARLVAGGPGRPEGLNRGFFARPTVFADVTNDMELAREEVFGPVLAILPFDTEAEAIAIANDNAYGLTHYVQTADADRAARLARALHAGTVEINGRPPPSGAPFGGVKASGIGREGGAHGIAEFLEPKTISGWPS